jgi:hypothetical protein
VTARRYLPWARVGAGTLVTGAWGPARAAVTITAAVNGGADPATVQATLYGPGDVTGINARQVIRTDPPDGATDFESTLLPCVEFDEPTLPWLFTPAAASDDRLRPWLVLVVVPADAATLETDSGRPCPVLTIPADAGTQLPDLAQSWAWAHVQVTAGGDPVAVLADPAQSNATLSRLVCPCRLDPGTAYLAAVVPATTQGTQAGLGQPVDDGGLQPAWTSTTGYLQLPVYYSWSFSTGPEGDFETLVSRLRRVQLPADGLQGRPVDLTRLRAATGIGADGAGTVLPGALGGDPTGPPATDPLLAAALRALLDLSAPSPGTPGAADLPLALPTYGRWHAAARSAPPTGSGGWLAQLNLHPAARAVAAIGTRVVQNLQEELMTAAWQQAGQVEAANQLLRQAQLARAAGRTMLDRLGSMPAATCVAVTSAVHGRVLDPAAAPERATVLVGVRSRRVPQALLSAGLRRTIRPRGPLGRRSGVPAGELVTAVNDERVTLPAAPPDQPPGTVTVDSVATDPNGEPVPPLCTLTSQRLARIKPRNTQWQQTLEAVAAHQRSVRGCEPPERRPRPRLPLDDIKTVLVTALDPERTVRARVAARVELPADWHPPDPLEPVLAAPVLATSVYREVLRLDPQLILPAPQALPQNAVTSVGTNPWFIAAVMAGANHELCRELLWRGFPTDQRATCLRDFWDRSGRQPAPGTVPKHDIDPMTDWNRATPLATHAGAGTAQTVVLLRGELLRRFPRTTVYLARARRTQPDPTQPATYDLAPVTGSPGDADYIENYPVFTGDLPPDIAFLGFDVAPQEAVGSDTAANPGYYLVFQEPLTEARLGLDAERPEDVPFDTWAQLAWTDVTVTRHHIDLAASRGPTPNNARGLHLDRTGTSAQIAAALEQQPVRAAIHLSNLLEAP